MQQMKKWLIFLGVAVSMILATAVLALDKPVELSVSAAASLKDVLLDIQKSYEQKESKIKIVYNFGSSGALQAQIEQGVPCDLFISAALKQADDLERKGLFRKGTRKNLLMNQLVLIVPLDAKSDIQSFVDLASDNARKIGIGEPASVPAGQYALEVFKYLGIWERIQGKTVLGTNVRTVLTYVETGNVDAGVVYKTDALISDKVKVVAVAGPETHQPIIYPAAVLSGADHPKEATKFLAYLSGKEARSIFEKYGFTMVK
jgi:molybdate transport system substrate-binding protein